MRTCVVTGASSGIGLATARRLLEGGDRVIACARHAARLDAAVAELGKIGPVIAAPVDVADVDQVNALFADLDGVDVLVAAAGVCHQARLDDKDSDDVWHEAMGVNLHGAYHSLRAAAQRMPRGGSMVCVSSGLGKNARAGYAAYCAAKHGLLGLVKCAALELAPRIRVNAVCPGWVDTPMSRADLEDSARRRGVDANALREECIAALPLGRLVMPDDVAAQICFLLSDDAKTITGQSVNVSSGEFFN